MQLENDIFLIVEPRMTGRLRKRRRFPSFVGGVSGAILFLMISGTLCGDQGSGDSGEFWVDTRWGFDEGSGVSDLMTIDTRVTGRGDGDEKVR